MQHIYSLTGQWNFSSLPRYYCAHGHKLARLRCHTHVLVWSQNTRAISHIQTVVNTVQNVAWRTLVIVKQN